MYETKGFRFTKEEDGAVTIENSYLGRSLTLTAVEWDEAVAAVAALPIPPKPAEEPA